MANDVFANGREISCKKADGKSICCFPDVCFTPPDKVPPTPPGVPIPYPNTGMAKDTTKGSKKVKITDNEVLLKNKSHFKTSMGNEAGCAQKKGIVTSKTKGKVFFTSWSMDVKFEGENVVRHLDLTTHNHGSATNTAPWPYADRVALAGNMKECESERKALTDNDCHKKKDGKVKCPDSSGVDKATKARNAHPVGSAPRKQAQGKLNKQNMEYEKACRRSPCNKAAACFLVTYEDGAKGACCPPQTPHHLVFDASVKGIGSYKHASGPCICAAGNASNGVHGLLHGKQKQWMIGCDPAGSTDLPAKKTTVGKWESEAAKTVEEIHPQCSAACIKAQLRKAHKKKGVAASEEVNMASAGASPSAVPDLEKAWNVYGKS